MTIATTAVYSSSSLDVLYTKCRNAVYNRLRTSYYEDIEDAIQAGMIKVVEALQEHPENTEGWFVQRAVFYAQTYMRDKVWKHENRYFEYLQKDLESTDEDYKDNAFYAVYVPPDDCINVEETLMALPEHVRRVVSLFAYGYTRTEIKEMLHISDDTVRRRLEAARALIEKQQQTLLAA